MKNVLVGLCCFAGFAISAGAQAVISGHTGDGTAGAAARLQRFEDLEAVRAIPACYGYGHDLIFKHLGADQTEAIDALQRCHVNALTTRVFLFDETTAATTLHSIRDLVAFVRVVREGSGIQQRAQRARQCAGGIHRIHDCPRAIVHRRAAFPDAWSEESRY